MPTDRGDGQALNADSLNAAAVIAQHQLHFITIFSSRVISHQGLP
jgi:hypothetical protein